MSNFLLMAVQSDGGGGGVIMLAMWACMLAFFVLVIASMWMVFAKAGEPGWACIVPFYNIVVLNRIAGRPGWWFILWLIPLVSFIIAIMVSIDIARKFGKGVGFGLGLVFLGFIFYPILGFGDAQYNANA